MSKIFFSFVPNSRELGHICGNADKEGNQESTDSLEKGLTKRGRKTFCLKLPKLWGD